MSQEPSPAQRRWAQFRFSIIGPLLAQPPDHGQLSARIAELAKKSYRHPLSGEAVRFGDSTIERWFYVARDTQDPVTALARKVPRHAGRHLLMTPALCAALCTQYQQHRRWTFQLHHDNLVALAREQPELGQVPSYTTVSRYMKDRGWLRERRRKGAKEPAAAEREIRSFEVRHVHALWHLDFHEGSRKVLTAQGEWKTPQLLGVLDDHSRLCCHLQWYLDQSAETLVHGFCQALAKRGLPRALLTDNGAAMLSSEFTQGLERLGIVHHTTLPYSPEQNAKQEVFWAQVEGRLMAMLEGEPELSLTLLNQATQAWVEGDYQRRRHDELGQAPLSRALQGPSLVRPCPDSDRLRRAFRTECRRAVRRSDGTFTLLGVRFELPWAYRTLGHVTLRVARWDLSRIDLIDPRTGQHLCTVLPLDKEHNADGRRRAVPIPAQTAPVPSAPAGIAPALRQLMAHYAQTGLPPAYLPREEEAMPLPSIEDLDDDNDNDSLAEHKEDR